MSPKLILGVDMAKQDFVAAIRVGDIEEELGKFENDASGRQALHDELIAYREVAGTQQIHLIIEATGGYEATLVAYAHEQHWLVSMPNPKQVRDWAKGVGYRVKTDRVDARMAHYGAERQPPTRAPLPVEVSQLDSLLKRRLIWNRHFTGNGRVSRNLRTDPVSLPKFERVLSRSLRLGGSTHRDRAGYRGTVSNP